ncbi:thioredoxin family protein [Listeria aquatica]|uniref:Thioredoxin family protein n=1 Tax=Listeria aquatica TaxID=1494960 RepID=A0A841ZM31_9LIST|nr:thioredoxin family protein [Listeria aquatica]MBC1521193.1 thioredoxin family protein [Listeria aquatica]
MLAFGKQELEAVLEEKRDQLLFFYTPMCGGCQVAREMIELVLKGEAGLQIAEMDLNYIPDYASQFEIESVPALVAIRNGELIAKRYEINNVMDVFEFTSKFA